MSDRLLFDDDLAALDALLRTGDVTAAFSSLEMFEARLVRYIRSEELLLFPVLERFIAVPIVTTAQMRTEHARLQGIVDTLWQALAQRHAERGLDTLCTLRSVLFLHCEKEERVLAPLLRVTGATSFES
jgi:hypothetical protein